MRKIAGYLTKNRSEKDQKIAQSTHENGYIKPRKTFWRNSKQLLFLTCFPSHSRLSLEDYPNKHKIHVVKHK
ncbi:hypothetical protein B5F25_06715 [Bacteroides sp. An19]|nr:hypothetical protein B5F25_06715 [Bacteroides sp. An19]